jgi:hypothetical protein
VNGFTGRMLRWPAFTNFGTGRSEVRYYWDLEVGPRCR